MARWHEGLWVGQRVWDEWMEAVPNLRREMLSCPNPGAQRVLLVRNPVRFANPALVQDLVDSARAVVRTDPQAASRLAALAVRVVTISLSWRVPEFLVRELGFEAAAVGANAQRVRGNLGAADRVLSPLVAELDRVGDPRVRLDVYSYAASLRKDQRRFEEAEGYLASALRICRALGDPGKERRLLLKRASIAFHRGQVGEALRRNRQVLRRGLEARDDEVCEWASHNLALCLLELERFAEATAWLEGNRARFRRKGDSAARLRCCGSRPG